MPPEALLVFTKEGEELTRYKTRFRNLADITVAQLTGEIILNKIIGSWTDINWKAEKESWEKEFSSIDIYRYYQIWSSNIHSSRINTLHHWKKQFRCWLHMIGIITRPIQSKQNNNDKKNFNSHTSNKNERWQMNWQWCQDLHLLKWNALATVATAEVQKKANPNQNRLLTRRMKP